MEANVQTRQARSERHVKVKADIRQLLAHRGEIGVGIGTIELQFAVELRTGGNWGRPAPIAGSAMQS
jgi:hypothetical protein